MFSLELAFANKELRSLCENEARATCDFGVEVAKKLKHRLADFHAAISVKDIVAGCPRPIEGQRIAVNLCEGYRIVFCANHNTIPQRSGNVNWSKVTRIKIVSIENDHG